MRHRAAAVSTWAIGEPITIRARDQERAQHRLALEFGSREEFEDPRFGYRRLFSELLGTFLLVLAAAGGGCFMPKVRSPCPRLSWRRA